MGRVFVVQKPVRRNFRTGAMEYAYDISPAEVYGELITLLENNQSALLPGPMRNILREKLKGFSDEDSILLIGDPAAMANSAMIASQENSGRVNVLKWDKFENHYIKLQLLT